jgi:hypothetical protein
MKPIYTAHRCEETGAIIITPAHGADVRIQHPISEAHSSVVVDMEQEDHSHLIGKWVKCVTDKGGMISPDEGEWVFVEGINSGDLNHHLKIKRSNGCVGLYPMDRFGLSDPRDENPDEPKETMIPFDLERWKAGEGILRTETQGGDEVTNLTHFEGMCLIGKVNHSLGFWGESGKCNHFRPNNDLTLIVKR